MKKKLAAAGAALLLALCALGFTYQGQRWEYKINSVSISEDELDSAYLSSFGGQGWELVAVENAGRRRTYFFKRLK
jgi:hypothetical protein